MRSEQRCGRDADRTVPRLKEGVLPTSAVARLVFSLLVISLSPYLAHTQTPPQKGIRVADAKTVSRHAAEPLPPSPEQLAAIEKHLSTIETDQKASSSDIQEHLNRVEKEIADLKRSSLVAALLPALIAGLAGLGGVFLGGLINHRLQTKLAEKQATLQIGNAVVEWQLKQLSLLYGPVRALLGQSFGLYRQMNKVLEAADSKHFRLAQVGGSLDGQQFQIQISPGNWERFRTVIHISQVYGKGLGVETYFDDIVSIGKRIVTIIEQHAGYARPQEKDLMTVFARYLAHFAVLNHLHAEAKRSLLQTRADTGEPPMKVDLSAVFPEELHDLINNGFQAISRDIEEWRGKAGA